MSPNDEASRRAGWALALVATFTMVVSYVDRQTIAVLAPTVTRALGISDREYGFLASAFAVAYLVGAPISGRLIDTVGARRGLLGAVLAWSAIAALHALAPGLTVLFGLRVALGLAESPSFPGAAQTVHRALPPQDRARGFGILFTGSSIGAMIVPPIATSLNDRFGFRIAMLVTALVGLVWVPVWIAVAYSPRGRAVLDAKSHDIVNAPRTSPWRLLRHRAQLRAIALVVASAPFIAFMLSWGAKYLVTDFHRTQAEVGRLLWLPPLVFDAGAIGFGVLSSRRTKRPAYDGSPDRALVGAATALTLTACAMPLSPGPWTAMILGAVAMAGGGALYALATADVLARVPPEAVSTAGGLCVAAQSLANIVANPLIGASVERLHSYAWIVVALAVWNLPGAVVWLVVEPPQPHGFSERKAQTSSIS